MKESPFLIQLQTCLASLPDITTEVCFAELIVGQGKMHVCKITTRTGHLLLEHKEAITHLQQCGSVEWSLLPMADLDLLLQTVPAPPKTSSSTSFALGVPL